MKIYMAKLGLFCGFLFMTSCSYLQKNPFEGSSPGKGLAKGQSKEQSSPKANAIFFHPDGMSLSHWDIGRIITKGPDGESSWDKMPFMAVYKSHAKDSLVPSSHAGATMHAYGEKVSIKSFGTKNQQNFARPSLLKEAQLRGLKTGLVQSGVLMEPGTAVFVSSSASRKDYFNITKQLIFSNTDILLGGGEKYLLPKGEKGHFGMGVRPDHLNLIALAKKEGYYVIYTLKELKNIPKKATKVLGVFAYENTYNDKDEQTLKQKNLKAYNPEAPSIQEMSKYALEFLSRDKQKNFFLVAEEEGTDNFSNKNNATGLFIAIKRSLKAIEFFREFVKKNKNTLLIVASDSNASSPALIDLTKAKMKNPLSLKKTKPATSQTQTDPKLSPLSETSLNKTGASDFLSDNGAPLDRQAKGQPFLAPPDKKGLRLPFEIAWPTKRDTGTGVVIKAEGYKADQVKGLIDNTDVYKILKSTLWNPTPRREN